MFNAEVTSLSSKGQVVIPEKIRRIMKLTPGDKMVVLTDGINLLLKPVEEPKVEVFKRLVAESRKFARTNKLRKPDLVKAVRKVRRESRP